MKQSLSVFLLLGALLVIGYNRAMPNESRAEAQRIKNYLSGQRVLATYRDGGPIYGTYFFYDIHFCPSGQYMEFGQSRKQTILDNVQVNNWKDYGTWDVVSFQGQVVLQINLTSGGQKFFLIRLLPDGRIWVRDDISVVRQGSAQCR